MKPQPRQGTVPTGAQHQLLKQQEEQEERLGEVAAKRRGVANPIPNPNPNSRCCLVVGASEEVPRFGVALEPPVAEEPLRP